MRKRSVFLRLLLVFPPLLSVPGPLHTNWTRAQVLQHDARELGPAQDLFVTQRLSVEERVADLTGAARGALLEDPSLPRRAWFEASP